MDIIATEAHGKTRKNKCLTGEFYGARNSWYGFNPAIMNIIATEIHGKTQKDNKASGYFPVFFRVLPWPLKETPTRPEVPFMMSLKEY